MVRHRSKYFLKELKRNQILGQHRSKTEIDFNYRLDVMYFFRYGSPSVVAHLYFAGAPDNLFFTGYQRLAKEARLNLMETSYEIFLANHDRFLMYESSGLKVEGPAAIGRAGYCLKSARSDVMGTLYEFAK